ncbi:MAG: hypothetical protein ACI82F_002460, partial [Planctomycetota bacterium]
RQWKMCLAFLSSARPQPPSGSPDDWIFADLHSSPQVALAAVVDLAGVRKGKTAGSRRLRV